MREGLGPRACPTAEWSVHHRRDVMRTSIGTSKKKSVLRRKTIRFVADGVRPSPSSLSSSSVRPLRVQGIKNVLVSRVDGGRVWTKKKTRLLQREVFVSLMLREV